MYFKKMPHADLMVICKVLAKHDVKKYVYEMGVNFVFGNRNNKGEKILMPKTLDR